MAARSISPGGALLRNSRIFTIPAPLQHSAANLSEATVFNSETATLPHPTRLAITTPQSSRAKGDWGLKRSLPLRVTTKTSSPAIRVAAIDTYEHVTEFASAADHTLALQKWNEMGIPLSIPKQRRRESNYLTHVNASNQSVFEESIDNTSVTEGSEKDVRWKFTGPWLPGLSVGEFNKYAVTEVRRRKTEFQLFLRDVLAKKVATENASKVEEGKESPSLSTEVTQKEFTDFVKSLRRNRTELFPLIRKFLDLPPASSSKLDDPYFMETLGFDELFPRQKPLDLKSEDFTGASDSPYAEFGPPRTHPSAGLSYARSSAHTFNHPVYGPQKSQPPVQARIVMPKGATTGNQPPLLGVGGFITDLPFGDGSFDFRTSKRKPVYSKGRNTAAGGSVTAVIPGLSNIEPNKVGGSKTYVQPAIASVDSQGRVVLTVEGADPEAVAVHRGTVSEIPSNVQRSMDPISMGSKVGNANGGYGLKSAISPLAQLKERIEGLRGSSK